MLAVTERVTPSSKTISGSADYPLALPVLVLNRLYQPVNITSVRRAMILLFTGSAAVIGEAGDFYDFTHWRALPVRDGVDDVVALVDGGMRVPRVIHLHRYAAMRRPPIRLTRRNLMLRDDHRCQYCGRRAPRHLLNIDHVVPRSRGGLDCWENLVTSCQHCNLRKGQHTPREAAMPLLRRPRQPSWSVVTQLLNGACHRYVEWEPFLTSR